MKKQVFNTKKDQNKQMGQSKNHQKERKIKPF